MTPPPTPGAYIKARRTAQRLSIADVAAAIATVPERLAEHIRAEWIEQIEADVMPASFTTITALRSVMAFDVHVLTTLDAIAHDYPVDPPRLCRICACSEQDPCLTGGAPCAWVGQDLCSSCCPTRVA